MIKYKTPLTSILTIYSGFLFSTISLHADQDKTTDLDPAYYSDKPFGTDTRWAKDSDNVATGMWWKTVPRAPEREKSMRDWFIGMLGICFFT